MARTFVLVHGAWHGGWCYSKVADIVRSRGHRVYTPTLTGLGERSHVIDFPIDCSTHILDVVNLIKWEELDDLVLCGHSYGGQVIGGVAEQMSERIAAIVYLDAVIPRPGMSILDYQGDSKKEHAIQDEVAAFATSGRTLPQDMMPPMPAAEFNVNAADRERVDRLCTPHPVGTFRERLALTEKYMEIPRKIFVEATDWVGSTARTFYDAIEDKKGWSHIKVACGHDIMLNEPEELARILQEAP